MLAVVFGNKPEELLSALSGEIAKFRSENGPFVAPTLLFGHGALRDEALIHIAETNGIAAHLQTPTLDAFAAPLFSLLNGKDETVPTYSITRAHWQAALLDLFVTDVDACPDVVKRYVQRGHKDGPAAEDVRAAIELSSRLAALFEGYALTRPDWITEARSSVQRSPEEWQHELLSLALVRMPHGRTIAELAGALSVNLVSSKAELFPKSIFFYGPGPQPEAVRRLMVSVGRLTDVTIFAFNPCQELWDDLATARGGLKLGTDAETGPFAGPPDAAADLLVDSDGMPVFSQGLEPEFFEASTLFEAAQDPELLVRWGRPLREQVRLWNAAIDSDFVDEFAAKYPPTALGALQQSLAARAPFGALPNEESPPPVSTPEPSLALFSASSPSREAEFAASVVVARAAKHGTPLDRFAIVVPPGAESLYLPKLRSAFAELGLPMRGYGVHAEGVARRISAATALLHLPVGERTPKAIVALAREPALDFEDNDPFLADRLAGALDGAGIAFGHTTEDLVGTYLTNTSRPAPSNTFSQGLDRLALGLFHDRSVVEVEGFPRPIAPLPPEDVAPIARVATLLREADTFAKMRAPLHVWGEALDLWVRRYLRDENEGDVRASATVCEALRSLASLDLSQVEPAVEPGPPQPASSRRSAVEKQDVLYGYSAVSQLALAALSQVSTATRRGGGGVLCGPLEAFRGLPLQGAVVLGFAEGSFPRKAQEDPLDLRRNARRAGDLFPEERDRTSLLELLCAAREFVYFTWTAYHAVSGDAEPVSPLAGDLRASVGESHFPTLELPRAPWTNAGTTPPAEPHQAGRPPTNAEPHQAGRPTRAAYTPSAGYAAFASPTADRLRRAQQLGEKLRRARGGDLPLALHRALEGEARAEAARLVAVPELPAPAPAALKGRTARISIADLIAYVRCPVQGAARARLRLREGEEAPQGRDGDPFDFQDFALDNLVQDTLFSSPVSDPPSLRSHFERAVLAYRVAGTFPQAPYAEQKIADAADSLEQLAERFRGRGRALLFAQLGPGGPSKHTGAAASGGAPSGGNGRIVWPASTLAGRLLVGPLPPLVDDAIVLPGKGGKAGSIVRGLPSYRLAELIVTRAVMVACLGQRVDAVRVLDAGNNRPSSANNDYTDREELPELSPEEATEFLEGLIEAAFATVEPRYAPLEAWMTGARTSTEFFRHREDIGQSQNGGALRLPYCAKGPVPGFRTWPVPDDDTLKNEQFLRLSDYEQLLKQPERW